MVGCDECVSVLDRRCESDRDCRPEESCETVEGTKVCIYEPAPVKTCPGAEGCQDGSGTLQVGAASKVVTPMGYETPTDKGVDDDNYMNFSAKSAPEDKWNDCGQDGICPDDPNYPGKDEGEGDGVAQGLWIAGFSVGRPAQYCPEEKVGCDAPDCCVSKYAHDNLKVQITAVTKGDVTVVFAALDTIGWFHTDIEAIRDRIPDDLGVDYLVMAATHNHEAPDTAGQWGPGTSLPDRSGRTPRFIEKIYSQTVSGIEEAVEGAEPATAQATVLDVGWEGLAVDDSRPPYIFNDDVPVVRFASKEDDETIATLLSFGNHAEVRWSNNPYITADFPHFVRKYIREGLDAVEDDQGETVEPALPGLGGTVVWFPGSVGGLINPGDGGATAYGGEEPEGNHSWAEADALGQQLASRVLKAHEDGALETVDSPDLSFAKKEFLTPIANRKFQLAAFSLGVLERDVYNAVKRGPFDYQPGLPQLLTEVGVIRLGSVTFFTAPGEVFPESLVGGYPGKKRVRDPVVGDVREIHSEANCDEEGLPTDGGDGSHPCIVKADQENPPDWEKAPSAPYVYEQIPGEHPFFIGLGGDFLGYMVPSYDFETDDYVNQAPGSHYEETNGVGPDVISDWKTHLGEAIEALPE